MSVVIIDWGKFLEGQKKLDSYIFDLKKTSYSDTSEERLLALIVEVNELVNSSKVFKFWSLKEADKIQVLDEFVDVFHFILSFFLEKNIDPSGIFFDSNKSTKTKKELTVLFLELISSFNRDMSCSDFKFWVQKFLNLGGFLGFSWKEIEDAYWSKWNVNMERQNRGY